MNKNQNKSMSIPLVVILLPIMAIIIFVIFSLNIYANSSDINTEVLIGNNINDEENNILQISIETEENNKIIEENNVEEEVSENEQVYTYTAENGKTYEVIASLNIPSLGINYPILSKTSDELLKISLNKYWGANPNEEGNMVILGHNYKDGKFFSNLPKIENGAIVQIKDLKGKTLEYKVYETQVIDPYDNSCTSQLTNGKTEVTLITCFYEKGNSHATKRFVAKARAN